MTIEQKAQRYNEALKRAKKLYEQGTITESLNYVFPELKESEDKRMKKIISDILLIDSDEIREILDTNNVLMQNIDAWLEKQSDINRRIQEEIEKQTKQQWKSEKHGNNISGECNDTALEEQLQIWFEKGKCSGIDDVIFHPQKYGLEKQGEQKPAWSKEDENILLQIINEIEAIKLNSSTIFEKNIAQDKIDWLKSLKDRV